MTLSGHECCRNICLLYSGQYSLMDKGIGGKIKKLSYYDWTIWLSNPLCKLLLHWTLRYTGSFQDLFRESNTNLHTLRINRQCLRMTVKLNYHQQKVSPPEEIWSFCFSLPQPLPISYSFFFSFPLFCKAFKDFRTWGEEEKQKKRKEYLIHHHW